MGTTDIDQIKLSLQKIEAAILGDEYHPDGLMSRVAKIEKEQENIKKKIVWYVGLASGALAVISFVFKNLFK
jgi:hypothetical protein